MDSLRSAGTRCGRQPAFHALARARAPRNSCRLHRAVRGLKSSPRPLAEALVAIAASTGTPHPTGAAATRQVSAGGDGQHRPLCYPLSPLEDAGRCKRSVRRWPWLHVGVHLLEQPPQGGVQRKSGLPAAADKCDGAPMGTVVVRPFPPPLRRPPFPFPVVRRRLATATTPYAPPHHPFSPCFKPSSATRPAHPRTTASRRRSHVRQSLSGRHVRAATNLAAVVVADVQHPHGGGAAGLGGERRQVWCTQAVDGTHGRGEGAK